MENNVSMWNESAPSPKRLLLYVHWDRNGKVDPHIVYQIKALYEFGISIIFISNSSISEEDKQILSPYIMDIRLRPNEGFDFTAWKETILELGSECISRYDELILMNSSCYGPFFPLEEMFSKMDKEKVDFWGIMENTDSRYIDHIVSNFCVFRRTILCNDIFMNFWKHLEKISTFRDCVYNGELRMTKYFIDNGYHYSVYANIDKNIQDIPSIGVEQPFPYYLVPYYVRNFRIPFGKAKMFHTQPGKLFNIGQELFTALEDCGSNYPSHLIIDHLRRTQPLSWQKNLPGTLTVLDENASIHTSPELKIAVFAHLFYMDQVEEAFSWLSNIPYPFDLYISTSSVDKAATIQGIAEKHVELRAQRLEIRVMEDRGRDVAPWLLGFKDVQENYDIALKFHLKKAPTLNSILTQEWSNFDLKSVLASPGYVSGIINMFKEEDRLGIVFHVFPPALILYQHRVDGNAQTITWRNEILNRLNINIPMETSCSIYPNNIFWYRPKSMHNFFNSDIGIDEFPKEPFPVDGTIAHGIERAIPYIVQGNGYYYKLSLTSRMLTSNFQHYEDHIMNIDLQELNKSIKTSSSKNKYINCAPQEIPIGRAFQIGFMSLYGHIRKYFLRKKAINVIKKNHKYNPTECWEHIYDIGLCCKSIYTKNIKISSHIINTNSKNFVLILPAIDKQAFSAGPNTAFRFASEIAKKGYNIQAISLNRPACTEEILYNHLVSALGVEHEVAKRFHVSDMTKDITLSHGDHVCATASWTLPAAIKIAKKTGTQYPMYFIQDCEPCFWGWGPGHACLMEGYAETFLPVINTKSLAKMLFNIGIGSFSDKEFRERTLIFQPSVDRALFYPEPQKHNKRILFVYTRFGETEQRNMYQLALEAVSRAVDSGLLSSETWEIHCYGAQEHEPVVFSSGIKTVMLPSLDMAAYAREIRQASLILYLVLSPHTGYMPLEAAACGVPAVTNTYLNKTADYLRQISPLIHPARPTLDGVAEALATELLSLTHGKNGLEITDFPAIPSSWNESFAPIMPKVQEWLQRP